MTFFQNQHPHNQAAMAATLQPLRLTARSCTCRVTLHQYGAKHIGKRRALSTTPSRWKAPSTPAQSPRPDFKDPLQAIKESHSHISKIVDSETWDAEEKASFESELESGPPIVAPMMEKMKRRKPKDTFLNMGDPEPWEEDGQLEDDHDDITTLGHGELEKHREMRHYARLTAWEMPLLASMSIGSHNVYG